MLVFLRLSQTRPVLTATLRRATTADAPELTAIYLASRRDALPGLKEVHSEPEVLAWVTHLLIPNTVVRVAHTPLANSSASARGETTASNKSTCAACTPFSATSAPAPSTSATASNSCSPATAPPTKSKSPTCSIAGGAERRCSEAERFSWSRTCASRNTMLDRPPRGGPKKSEALYPYSKRGPHARPSVAPRY